MLIHIKKYNANANIRLRALHFFILIVLMTVKDIATGESFLFAPRLPTEYAVWLGEIKPLSYYKVSSVINFIFTNATGFTCDLLVFTHLFGRKGTWLIRRFILTRLQQSCRSSTRVLHNPYCFFYMDLTLIVIIIRNQQNSRFVEIDWLVSTFPLLSRDNLSCIYIGNWEVWKRS